MSLKSPFEVRKVQMANNLRADIVFLVGEDEERVPAYKQILAVSNFVFMEILYGKFKNENEIKIPEFEAEEFRQFLNYMYFQEIDLQQSNPLIIYMIAHKYMVYSLLELCSDKIYEDVSYENVFEAMGWLNVYENEKISRRIQEFFSKNVIGCLKVNPGFKGLTKESIVKILKMKELRCSEVLLYENLLMWADQQLLDQGKMKNLDNKKQVLEGILQLIQLKINEDLTLNPIYNTTSRCIWSKLKVDHSNIQTSSLYRWCLKYNCVEKTVCFGFKMLLSNLTSDVNLVEEFDFSISNSSTIKKIENFKIPIRDTMTFKDIYFKNPVILDGDVQKLYIDFATVRERLLPRDRPIASSQFGGSLFGPIIIEVNCNFVLLTEPFSPNLHNIFVKEGKI